MALPTIRRTGRPSWMTPYGSEGMGDIWSDRLWPEWPRWQSEEMRPSIDFYEKDGNYHLTVDLPGVKKDDISVDIDGNVLTVSGKKSSEREEKEADYYLRESSYGSFTRSLRLPAEVNEEDVDATYKDGVLKLVMKPKEGAKARKIEIKG
ncbi:MAG: Hsp20/alpha crystallin family protein [Deltaproteobacteria bacterium]